MENTEKREMKFYTLREISEWQLNENSTIKLPSMQRGFVWKPYQIEALWDSIFRGYPIGAILMSVDNQKNERLLLDGQQRSTYIALGFFNPYDENRVKDFGSLQNYLPSVWIDLQPAKITQNQKFLFRVLTKSHPWGYQNVENGKTLQMSDRRNAFNTFKEEKKDIESYIKLLPSDINPWDAYYPVPLSFVLDLENKQTFEEFKNGLQSKLNNLSIRTKYSEQVNYNEITDESLKFIFNGLQNVKNLQIPEIQVKAEILKEDDDTLQNESQDPTLFIRLNKEGTKIDGEELIYSIYKATFPESKELVEKIGTSFIPPSKVINIFSRLINCELNEYKHYTIPYNINTFRKAIKDNNYKSKLEDLIKNNTSSELIETAKKIIRQNKTDFPDIILKQIIVSDIDLFFILLTYIKKNHLSVNISEEKIKEISSNYVYFLWFAIDRKKSYSKLFSYLFKDNLSWKDALNELINNELVVPLLQPEILKNELQKIVQNLKNYNDIQLENSTLELIKKDSFEKEAMKYWNELIGRIRGNKSMLLYAQRSYLNEKFKEFNQIENIEDTNRPWDYDHIYPSSWVKNKESINLLVKNWVNTIGNYRALSYDDNRSENNNWSPQRRLNEDHKRTDSFVFDNDFEYWNKLDDSHRRIKHQNDGMAKNFLNAVIHRMCNIYEEWYNKYYKYLNLPET